MLVNFVLFLISIYLSLGLFISGFGAYIIVRSLMGCKEIKNERI